MWRPGTIFYEWTDLTSTHPRGGVAPLRHDLALARYLERQREHTQAQIVASTGSDALPKKETIHGFAVIAGIFGSK
jgi:hypothetical protein